MTASMNHRRPIRAKLMKYVLERPDRALLVPKIAHDLREDDIKRVRKGMLDLVQRVPDFGLEKLGTDCYRYVSAKAPKPSAQAEAVDPRGMLFTCVGVNQEGQQIVESEDRKLFKVIPL